MNEIERKYFDAFNNYLKSSPVITFTHNELNECVKIQIDESYSSEDCHDYEKADTQAIVFNGEIYSDSLKESEIYDIDTPFELILEVPKETISGYIPDFILYTSSICHASVKFAIEIDGHNFHEKTKEQASNDKKKDRTYLKNCFIPIRFTGSDVYHDAESCVKDTLEIFFQLCIKEFLFENKSIKLGANITG